VNFRRVLLQGIVWWFYSGKGRAEQAWRRYGTCLRPGHGCCAAATSTIDAADLVPGDILPARTRVARVCCGLRLDAGSRYLMVDESMPTGESVPVEKGLDPQPAEAALGRAILSTYSVVWHAGRGRELCGNR